MDYRIKYLKYKNKYLNLKIHLGGATKTSRDPLLQAQQQEIIKAKSDVTNAQKLQRNKADLLTNLNVRKIAAAANLSKLEEAIKSNSEEYTVITNDLSSKITLYSDQLEKINQLNLANTNENIEKVRNSAQEVKVKPIDTYKPPYSNTGNNNTETTSE
jgi:hypothetical protein